MTITFTVSELIVCALVLIVAWLMGETHGRQTQRELERKWREPK
jgi:hypothetical protein